MPVAATIPPGFELAPCTARMMSTNKNPGAKAGVFIVR